VTYVKLAYVNKVLHEIFEKLTRENEKTSEKNFFFMNADDNRFILLNSKGKPPNSIFVDLNDEHPLFFDHVKGKTYILPENLFLNLIKYNEKLATAYNDLLDKYSNSPQTKS
jgi:hypothetical protein